MHYTSPTACCLRFSAVGLGGEVLEWQIALRVDHFIVGTASDFKRFVIGNPFWLWYFLPLIRLEMLRTEQ